MPDKHASFYEQVYSQDNKDDRPHGWIQWKGTDVCIDLHCACGHHGHCDASFFYFYRCPGCGASYAVGQVVKLIRLTDEQVKHVEQDTCGFTEDTIEEKP